MLGSRQDGFVSFYLVFVQLLLLHVPVDNYKALEYQKISESQLCCVATEHCLFQKNTSTHSRLLFVYQDFIIIFYTSVTCITNTQYLVTTQVFLVYFKYSNGQLSYYLHVIGLWEESVTFFFRKIGHLYISFTTVNDCFHHS